MIDDDLDAPGRFREEEPHTENLPCTEIWDNNPPLKIVLVLGAALVLGIYIIFFYKGDELKNSKMRT